MGTFKAPTKAEFRESEAWGMLTAIDLHGCSPKIIRDGKAIENFTHKLCKKIKVNMFGPTQVVHFGADPRVQGYSMTQLIETSLVSAHFAEETNSVYLDVFSCKFYHAKDVVAFANKFFRGTHFNAYSVLRGTRANLPKVFQKKMSKRHVILEENSAKK